MTTRRRQSTFIDTYPDLPAWVRMGARLFEAAGGYDTNYLLRTVISITKTQIVCVEGHDPDQDDLTEYRYRRSNCGRIAPGKSEDGNTLANPHDQHVRNALAVQALTRVYLDVGTMYRDQISHATLSARPRTVEEAVDRLNQVADLVRDALLGIGFREDNAIVADRANTEEGNGS